VHGDVGAMLAGTLAQLPAVWVLTAVAVVVFGLLPRFSAAAWGALAACVLILLVGQTLQLSQWLLDISPFTHIPHLPGGNADATPFVALTAVALLLTTAGLLALRRRNIPA